MKLPVSATALRTTALACFAAGTAACAGSAATHAAPAPSGSPPASAAAATAPPGDPRAQLVGAYEGMWHAYAAAAGTGDYQTGALSHYAAGDALAVLTRSLYDNHQDRIVLRGAPALHPQVTGMSPPSGPDTASVTDCADDSRWLQYTTAGRPASGATAGRHSVYARLQLFGTEWKVTYLVVGKAGTC